MKCNFKFVIACCFATLCTASPLFAQNDAQKTIDRIEDFDSVESFLNSWGFEDGAFETTQNQPKTSQLVRDNAQRRNNAQRTGTSIPTLSGTPVVRLRSQGTDLQQGTTFQRQTEQVQRTLNQQNTRQGLDVLTQDDEIRFLLGGNAQQTPTPQQGVQRQRVQQRVETLPHGQVQGTASHTQQRLHLERQRLEGQRVEKSLVQGQRVEGLRLEGQRVEQQRLEGPRVEGRLVQGQLEPVEGWVQGTQTEQNQLPELNQLPTENPFATLGASPVAPLDRVVETKKLETRRTIETTAPAALEETPVWHDKYEPIDQGSTATLATRDNSSLELKSEGNRLSLIHI